MTTYTCPAGHVLPGAWKHDLYCEPCGGDVIALSPPPDYQPAEPTDDELMSLWADAMAVRDD